MANLSRERETRRIHSLIDETIIRFDADIETIINGVTRKRQTAINNKIRHEE